MGATQPGVFALAPPLPGQPLRVVFGVSKLEERGLSQLRPQLQTPHGSTCLGPICVTPMGLGDVVNDPDTLRGTQSAVQ